MLSSVCRNSSISVYTLTNVLVGKLKSVVSKAGKRIGMLGRLRSNLTTHSENVVYTSFIRPVMEYGDTVWTCCGKVNAQELERLQNCAARIVTKCSHSDTALSNLKWDSLKCRHEHHVFNLVKKSLRGQCPQFLRNYFILTKDVRRVTRQSNLLHLPKVRTETAKRSFYYNGCIVFNKLSSSNQGNYLEKVLMIRLLTCNIA